MVLADDAALQQSPERFNGVGVNFAVNVSNLVIDDLMLHEALDANIALELVGNENGIGKFNVVTDELGKILRRDFRLVHVLRNDVAATFNDADYGRPIRSTSTLPVRKSSMGTVALAGLSAKIRFVHFADAAQKFALFKHGVANPHSHVPSRVFVHLEIAAKLASGNALFSVQHKRDRQKPLLKVQVGVVKDRVNRHAERGVAAVAVMPRFRRHRRDSFGFAVRAHRLSMPANPLKMGQTISFSWEPLVNRYDVHGYRFLRRKQV